MMNIFFKKYIAKFLLLLIVIKFFAAGHIQCSCPSSLTNLDKKISSFEGRYLSNKEFLDLSREVAKLHHDISKDKFPKEDRMQYFGKFRKLNEILEQNKGPIAWMKRNPRKTMLLGTATVLSVAFLVAGVMYYRKNLTSIVRSCWKGFAAALGFGPLTAVQKLKRCIQRKDFNGVKTLLDQDSKLINILYEGGLTPLHVAAKDSSGEIVKLLLHRGANSNAKSIEGSLPITCAIRSLNRKTYECLRDYRDRAIDGAFGG